MDIKYNSGLSILGIKIHKKNIVITIDSGEVYTFNKEYIKGADIDIPVYMPDNDLSVQIYTIIILGNELKLIYGHGIENLKPIYRIVITSVDKVIKNVATDDLRGLSCGWIPDSKTSQSPILKNLEIMQKDNNKDTDMYFKDVKMGFVNVVDGQVVDLPTAKLLKENGFDAPTHYYYVDGNVPYVKNGLKRVNQDQRRMNHNKYDVFVYSTPTKSEMTSFIKSHKLKLSNIDQLHKYINYTKEDYRYTIFKFNSHRLNKKVVGLGNHNRIISKKHDKTFMTFYSESPFGKLYNKLFTES